MKVIVISGHAGHGKDTLAYMMKDYLEETDNRVLITHFGDLLKYICKTLFDWDGKKDDAGRSLLQYVGTDIVRKQQPDFFIDFLVNILKLFPSEWDYILIPDCRFPNEITCFRENEIDVIHIRINRTNFDSGLSEDQLKHLSETMLDNYSADYYVLNDSTRENLKDKALEIINKIEQEASNGCN